ncbi:MAG: hypothetical protein AVDCRST_MAG01-01-4324, partial [uncultured Rubrobacteraceae bacterium]
GTDRGGRGADAGARGRGRLCTLYRYVDRLRRGHADRGDRPERRAPGRGLDAHKGQPGLGVPGRPRRELQAPDAHQPRDHSPPGLRRPRPRHGVGLVGTALRAHLPDPLHPPRNLCPGHRKPHALRRARRAEIMLQARLHDRRRFAEGRRHPPRPRQPPPPRPCRRPRRALRALPFMLRRQQRGARREGRGALRPALRVRPQEERGGLFGPRRLRPRDPRGPGQWQGQQGADGLRRGRRGQGG